MRIIIIVVDITVRIIYSKIINYAGFDMFEPGIIILCNYASVTGFLFLNSDIISGIKEVNIHSTINNSKTEFHPPLLSAMYPIP